MHELSICNAIASTAAKHADGRSVTQVTVQIGHLRQVVPDALQFSWEVVSEATVLKDAALVIEQVQRWSSAPRAVYERLSICRFSPAVTVRGSKSSW